MNLKKIKYKLIKNTKVVGNMASGLYQLRYLRSEGGVRSVVKLQKNQKNLLYNKIHITQA